jgi:hypothetical protein
MRSLGRRALLTGALVVLAVAGGCKTQPKEAAPYPMAASRIVFVPQVRQVPIRAGEGAYPNLFDAESYAVWNPRPPQAVETADAAQATAMSAPEGPAGAMGTPASGSKAANTDSPEKQETMNKQEALEGKMEQTMDPVVARPLGLVIACRLVSTFPDRSIAYDAVGLRGIEVHLELPDGQVVMPAQTVIGSELTETAAGALRRYSRELTFYFPTGDFMVENPAANPSVRGMRLVLSGQSSAFHFEWLSMPDPTARLEAREDYQLRESASKAYTRVRDSAKRVSHTFD